MTGQGYCCVANAAQNPEHNAREAARRAHHDAFGANRGAPWRNPTEGGG